VGEAAAAGCSGGKVGGRAGGIPGGAAGGALADGFGKVPGVDGIWAVAKTEGQRIEIVAEDAHDLVGPSVGVVFDWAETHDEAGAEAGWGAVPSLGAVRVTVRARAADESAITRWSVVV
jgi:hypothetical protein